MWAAPASVHPEKRRKTEGEFIITRQGKQYALYSGLLDEAHTRGLASLDTELLQVPDDDNGNVAIVKAVVELPKVDRQTGEVVLDPETKKPFMGRFSGIGDASPENVNRQIAPHLIRMAETRAKARALRDAINAGAIPFEELADTDGADATPSRTHPGTRGSSRPTPIRSAAGGGPDPGDDGSSARTGDNRSRSSEPMARKSQVDLLETLAVEWRGENGVERLENRVGKKLSSLSRAEADEWIEKLTPENREGGSG